MTPSRDPSVRSGAPLSAWHPASLVATLLGIGRLPWVPGTWGSLAALPGAWAIQSAVGPWGLLAGTVAIAVIGIWAADAVARHMGRSDPQMVVIDEVAGQWLALVPCPADPILFAAGFFLFRLGDIVKPWPVSWVERRLSGGIGIVADDLAAGALAAGVIMLGRLIGGGVP